MTISSAPRRELAARLAEKTSRHHIVVWDDPARQYESIVDDVVPEGWRIERYEGSWWDLRRRVETAFSAAEPPKLVIYVPSVPPAADPLEEIRRASGGFKRLLPTVLKESLAGDLSPSRVNELGTRCLTLVAVEDSIEGGSALDPVLVAELGARDADGALALALLNGEAARLSAEGRDALAIVASSHLGVDLDLDCESDSITLARHVVLASVASAVGDEVVLGLAATWKPLTAQQLRHALDLADRASRADTLSRWGDLADQVARELGLAALTWTEGLADCDIARVMDDLAFAEAARRLHSDRAGALKLASIRCERSRWLRWRDNWSTRALADFEAIRSVARLHRALAEHASPADGTIADLYKWYADGAWRVDRAHRLMEAARFGLGRPGLDTAFTTERQAYLEWLDRVLDRSNRGALESPDNALPGQADTFESEVAGHSRVALVIVDALRLELGHRLAELLEGSKVSVRVAPAVALPPTVTAVGMANLLPEAAHGGVRVDLEGDRLSVQVGGRPIRTVEDRTTEYRRAAGRVEDHRLSDWLSLGDDVLTDRVSNADLLIVRSQEIDAAGEQGLASVRWSQIDAAVEALAILIGRLTAGGVTRVVVTADHGFLALGRPIDASRVRPSPSGDGVATHGRAWIGRPATVPEGCTALALADFGVDSEERLIVTDGMTVFGAAGAGFFHGGISPQEALVPVLVVDATGEERGTADLVEVEIEIPGGKVSAEAFSTKIALGASLFTADVAVRITAADSNGAKVARLVPGESVDPHTGTVHLDPGSETILTFLVTEALDKGQPVQVVVLDAGTGRQLGATTAIVARDLRPEEKW